MKLKSPRGPKTDDDLDAKSEATEASEKTEQEIQSEVSTKKRKRRSSFRRRMTTSDHDGSILAPKTAKKIQSISSTSSENYELRKKTGEGIIEVYTLVLF